MDMIVASMKAAIKVCRVGKAGMSSMNNMRVGIRRFPTTCDRH